MRPRGGALLTVLLVTALLVVIGFALANLCVVSLHFARGFNVSTRANVLAEAAAQHFLNVYAQLSQQTRSNNLNLQSSTPSDLGLAAVYASGDGLPRRQAPGMSGTVKVTFDASQPYYSVDNSGGEYAAAGWVDRGTANRSVPPFTVDLLITVQLDSRARHYEAFIPRRWPYAVFSAASLIVMCATPTYNGTNYSSAYTVAPTLVSGAVATLQGQPKISTIWTNLSAPLYSFFVSKGSYQNKLVTQANSASSTEEVQPQAAVSIGPPIRYTAKTGVAPETVDDPGNALQGDAHVPTVYQANDGATPLGAPGIGFLPSVRAWPGNTFSGTVGYSDWPASLTATSNPVTDAQMPLADSSFKTITLQRVPMLGTSFQLLMADLTIDPSLTDQPPLTWGGGGSKYVINGDTGNQYVIQVSKTRSTTVNYPGKIILKNCLLFVNGDLNMAGSASGIQGTNATLIVSGTLNLAGGTLDSGDQGMVIFARNVITQASGDYHGLIMAEQQMIIVPPTSTPGAVPKTLSVHGAVLCQGDASSPLVLRSTNLTYDASYLKGLNAYGNPYVSMWREIP